jgi:hydroxyacylglutathione hydrolase
LLLKRFYHEGLAHASYLIGCQQTGDALVVDGNRDFDQYVQAASDNGLRITHVVETHIHADFLSGSRELAARVGARLYLSGEGGPDWQYAFTDQARADLLRDGNRLQVGNVRLDVIHTPGHTPEHLTFVVTDTLASERPVGALTGDFIFVGDVGRPDLLERAAGVEGTMRAGAKLLFESLRRFTEHYPDYLQLWPAHGAGSACGRSLGAVPQTTLGYEKLVNWAFQIDDEAQFAEAVLEGQPEPPRYFATMKRLNRDGPPSLPRTPAARQDAASIRPKVERDVVVDLRQPAAFGRGFIPGTLNIPLTRKFVSYAGWLLPYDRDIYLLSDDAGEASFRAAASELSMIGMDRVAGWFDATAFAAWQASGANLADLPRVTPGELAAQIDQGDVTVVDVRAESEFSEGRVPGSIVAPLSHLAERVRDVPREARVVLVCQSGTRSAIGASVLASMGFQSIANMPGGVVEWARAGLPLERDSAALAAS